MNNQNNVVAQTPAEQDRELLNRVVPAWARALNWVYERTFARLERFFEKLDGASTRQMIADFENAKAQANRNNQSN